MAEQSNIGSEIGATEKINGATIDVTKKDGVYTVNQISPPLKAPEPTPGVIPFSWSFGPVNLSGTINTKTYAISISISVVGINIGTFTGNLKDGITIKINLAVVSGSIRFYLKNGNELWVSLQLKVLFDGSYSGDYKIITF